MRYIRCWVIGCFFLFFVMSNTVVAQTMDSGFQLEELSKKDRINFLNNVEISLLTDEPPKKAIKCFDVSKDGLIAIGHASSEDKIIAVYTKEGIFQYGYEFNCTGTFGVEWDENKLMIYFVRSDVALMGTVESIFKIKDTSENNSYWNNHVFSTKRSIKDTEYRIRNSMGYLNLFASDYSQLVVVNSNGEESIIYDVNATQFSRMLVLVIGVLVFIMIVILGFINFMRQNQVNWTAAKSDT